MRGKCAHVVASSLSGKGLRSGVGVDSLEAARKRKHRREQSRARGEKAGGEPRRTRERGAALLQDARHFNHHITLHFRTPHIGYLDTLVNISSYCGIFFCLDNQFTIVD